MYKPVRGERPLWDFPDGTLAGRELAAYLVSEATGWDLVPPTVLRDGPFGPGMCQLWVEVDDSVDLVALSRSRHDDLRRMAVLDSVINNADRKGGHLLPRPDGRVQGVDHGICFAVEDKLRTLLWQWRGRRLDDEALEVLTRLRLALDGPLVGSAERAPDAARGAGHGRAGGPPACGPAVPPTAPRRPRHPVATLLVPRCRPAAGRRREELR